MAGQLPGSKTENGGATAQGRLSASEFNDMVQYIDDIPIANVVNAQEGRHITIEGSAVGNSQYPIAHANQAGYANTSGIAAAVGTTQSNLTKSQIESAIDAKVPKTTTVNGHELSSNVTVTKSDIGLGNVDNTSDANKPISTATQTALDGKASKVKVNGTEYASSGGMVTLPNYPSVPTVNNGTLTIQKNGTTVQTFSANQSGNATANITVPTNTSDLTNDSGFLTSHQDISGKEDKNNKVTSLTLSSTDTQYPSAKCVYDGLNDKASLGFDTVKIGDAEITATTKEDTLELVAGSNITLAYSIGNKQITISSTGGGGATYTAGDGIKITNNQISAKLASGVLDVNNNKEICFSQYFGEAETEDRNDGYRISITDSQAGDDAITFRLPYATTSKGGVMSKEDKTKLNTLQDYGFRLMTREGVLYVVSKNQLDLGDTNIELMRYGRYDVAQYREVEHEGVRFIYPKKCYRTIGYQYVNFALSLAYDDSVNNEYYYKVRITRFDDTDITDDLNLDRLMNWFSVIKLYHNEYRIGIKNGKSGFIMDGSKIFYSIKFAIRILDRVMLPFAVVMNRGLITSVTSSSHTPFSDFAGWKLK